MYIMSVLLSFTSNYTELASTETGLELGYGRYMQIWEKLDQAIRPTVYHPWYTDGKTMGRHSLASKNRLRRSEGGVRECS